MEEFNTELIEKLERVPLIVPTNVVKSILKTEGFSSSDPLCYRLVAFAVQNFLSEALDEVLDVMPNKMGGRAREQKLSLNVHDLCGALDMMGVKVQKPLYFADAPRGNQQ